jgi:hypothetical protein
MHDGTKRPSQTLGDVGFAFAGINSAGFRHRFRRDRAVIEVLAPDGIGDRATLITIPPARTVRVPGGTQALKRTELVEVTLKGRIAHLPHPNLLGAILVKAHAVAIDDAPSQQTRDLDFPLSLVDNPRQLGEYLRPKERSWLKQISDLLDPNPTSAVRVGNGFLSEFSALRGTRWAVVVSARPQQYVM